jgi:hypothetical protein
MPPTASSRVQTRAKNKETHPGLPDRALPRRASADVENERAAKAQATAARQEKKRQSILRTAEFENADIVNEDLVDATPRPNFTPKPLPPARNRKGAKLDPVAEASDNSDDDRDSLAYQPLDSEESVATGEESADESDPRPLAKRLKANATGKGKGIPKVGHTSPAKRSRRAVPRVEEAVDEAASEDETPVKPKKKAKPKLRDEINNEAKKLLEEVRKKADGVAGPAPAGQDRSATPPLSSSELEGLIQWGRELKRVGAIADLQAVARQTRQQSEDQSTSTKRVQSDNNTANPKRQVLPKIFSHVRVIADTRSIHAFLSVSQRFLYQQ